MAAGGETSRGPVIIDEVTFREKLKSALLIYKELDHTRDNIKQIQKLSLNLTRSAHLYAQQLQDFSGLLKGFTFSEESEADPIVAHFGNVFESFSRVHRDTVSEMNSAFNFPVAQLLKDVLLQDSTTELRNRITKAQNNYDNIQKKLSHYKAVELAGKSGAGSKARDPIKQEKLKQEMELASVELSKELEDCIETLKTVQAHTRVDFMQHLCGCMSVNVTHYRQAQDVAHVISPELERQKEVTAEALRHFESRKAQIKESKEKQASQQTTGNIPTHVSLTASQMGNLIPTTGSVGGLPPSPDEKQGYLYRLNRGRQWQMRLVVLTTDKLLKIISRKGKDEASKDNIFELIVCAVKRVVDNKLPYCFEVIHPRKRVMFRALGSQDYEDWIQSIQNSIAGAIAGSVLKPRGSVYMPEGFTAVAEMRKDPTNCVCADCQAPDPEWVVINTGALICIECSGIHRHFGVHISQVRSLTMDGLPRFRIQVLQKLPNRVVNSIFEETLPADYPRLPSNVDRETRTKFLTEKYVSKTWVAPYQGTPEQKQTDLTDALMTNNVPLVVKLIAQGANPKHANPVGVPLVHMLVDNALPVMVELLLLSGADVNAIDKEGRTALHYAVSKGSLEIVKLLVGHDAILNPKDTNGFEPLDLAQHLREKADQLNDEEEKFVEVEEYLTRKLTAKQSNPTNNTTVGSVAPATGNPVNSGNSSGYSSPSSLSSSSTSNASLPVLPDMNKNDTINFGKLKSPKSRKRFAGKVAGIFETTKDIIGGMDAKKVGEASESEGSGPNKFFTVYLPPADKKTLIFNADQLLRNALEKLAKAREFNLADFVPVDVNGNVVPLDTKLGSIEGYHVTLLANDPRLEESSVQDGFSPRDSDDMSISAPITANSGSQTVMFSGIPPPSSPNSSTGSPPTTAVIAGITVTAEGNEKLTRTKSGRWVVQGQKSTIKPKTREVHHSPLISGARFVRSNTSSSETTDSEFVGGNGSGSGSGSNSVSGNAVGGTPPNFTEYDDDDDIMIQLYESENYAAGGGGNAVADNDDGDVTDDGALSDIDDPYLFMPPPLPPTPNPTLPLHLLASPFMTSPFEANNSNPTPATQSSFSSSSSPASSSPAAQPTFARSNTGNATLSSRSQPGSSRGGDPLENFPSTSMPVLPQLQTNPQSTPSMPSPTQSLKTSEERLKLSSSGNESSPRTWGSRIAVPTGTTITSRSGDPNRRQMMGMGGAKRVNSDKTDSTHHHHSNSNDSEDSSDTTTALSARNRPNPQVPLNGVTNNTPPLHHTVSSGALRPLPNTSSTNTNTIPPAQRTRSAIHIRASAENS